MLAFVEHHPIGFFLWCQAQALFSLCQPLIDDCSSHAYPSQNFRNISVISTGKPLRMLTDEYHQNARKSSVRSEEHTSELQSLMRISYAVFCLKKKYYAFTLSLDVTNVSVSVTVIVAPSMLLASPHI